MSFGFSVSDIVALTTTIVKTIEDIHDAPAELQDLAERVGLVENTLEATHEKLSHDAPVRIMSNIVRLKDRINRVLSAMKDIVNRYRDNEGRVNPFHRVKYSLWDKGEISKLVIKLEERTNDLTGFLIVQTWDSTNQILPLIEQVLKHIRHDQEPAKSQSRTESSGPQEEIDIHATRSDQIGQVQAVLNKVLKTERPNEFTLLPDQEDISIEKEIELQLEQASIGSTFSEAIIDLINKQRNQLSHAEDFDPISYTRGENRLETPKGWIMVIDSSNEGNTETSDLALWISIDNIEVRSIIAQTYLELVRVWTVNNSGEWLFNRVESAGVQVETKFAKRCFKSQSEFLVKGGNAPESAALQAISGKKSYFRSEERKTISWRVLHSIEVAESTTGTFARTNTCCASIGRSMKVSQPSPNTARREIWQFSILRPFVQDLSYQRHQAEILRRQLGYRLCNQDGRKHQGRYQRLPESRIPLEEASFINHGRSLPHEADRATQRRCETWSRGGRSQAGRKYPRRPTAGSESRTKDSTPSFSPLLAAQGTYLLRHPW